ncbi:riboflavin synthase [Leptospira noguchii]|uniref:Riboflavin synthase n=2 Tax=Leptospira noguchii TaxID=28182 RepID=M6UHC9_9LEPT|nr:riboflavin synthase [Leptospira noguchii]EMO25647.1 riboflavin synthase, alpha subunit [Leptospira interrogans serovar Bataviae str. HAI135]EMO42211.1 riboflavin synthase, alpha subunit [Leptospira noguchii serovar Autumnalis str. ZUN142]EMS87960.1 riboflavin synthase, alpha subunit [Leptospira noguchii str. Hook]TQE76279.1 riboflavin synthase [Leptospira noguchii]UOG29601.1 riboflavin synthase [Leptospira noguchii]
MFTGLVETTGRIFEIQETTEGRGFLVETQWIFPDLKLGDSIAVNGCCQTVTEFYEEGNRFRFYASFKTLELTNFKFLKEGEEVNLERSALPSTRLGGHLVSGHVDGVGKILNKEERESGNVICYTVQNDSSLSKYIAPRGSITVDGISLTVVDSRSDTFDLILIPETLKKTNAKYWNPDTVLNLEIDLVARYLEQLLKFK